MPPAQRVAYQRALSMDAKPMGGDGAGGGGGLAGRRNVPCPTLVKQENTDAPIRTGAIPNGFPGGMGVCPPRGNPSNLFLHLFLCMPLIESKASLLSVRNQSFELYNMVAALLHLQ